MTPETYSILRMRQELMRHQWNPPSTPFLYAAGLETVCSCGVSPEDKPEDEYDWWMWHVTTHVSGLTPEGWRKVGPSEWEKVEGVAYIHCQRCSQVGSNNCLEHKVSRNL